MQKPTEKPLKVQNLLFVIQSCRVFAIQGLLMYWSAWKDSWDFRNYPIVSAVERCLLGGVPLYYH